ncbi:FliM/FliN family flagellar motor switch protein [Buchnera aphidicola]|uniref:Flagellar motor switch protein FliM n=1 Tax=Buchnera aphidicola subsp. Acyrthosiphon pisum (strain 5A) TaxID=563178 RepID=A0A7U4DIA4_BUCA5|nr:flagellar motor switch protein FliM [Buchnera aphidicola]ACL30456.1 flagellar motor switch protein FliM [Buchnera aphidicola str. 5A (Acyrthosiphon pisum)]
MLACLLITFTCEACKMGESKNLHNEIKILEKINRHFSDEFTKFFSNFLKNSVELVSCSIKIGSCTSNKEIITNLRCLNLIEILPYKKKSFIIFPYNFLSNIIDILFGGQGDFKDHTKKIRDITSTESLVNKKIMKFITNAFSEIYKKYFVKEINFFNTKIFFDFKKYNFDLNKLFLINCFNFKINNTEIFFNFLIPKSILKYQNEKKFFSTYDSHKNTCIEKNIENKVSLNDIYNVEVNIISKIIGISVSYDKIYNLSVGDVLSIKKPNKITGFIQDQAIFLGNYKRFNEQSIIFIEEFIDSSSESNQDKEYSNE